MSSAIFIKRIVLLLCIAYSSITFSQKKSLKKFTSSAAEMEIFTHGLDDFTIENNTENNFIEVLLFSENPEKRHIVFTEGENLATLKFIDTNFESEEKVFRKFITTRLERASVVVRISKGKKIQIFGDNIDVISKNYTGDLNISIEKGTVKLHQIKANVTISMYSGNVFAASKNAAIKVVSNLGTIKIDGKNIKKTFEKRAKNSKIAFSVISIKANIFLTTE